MLNNKLCVVVILTYNSSKIIKETICQALKITPYIYIVDSGSIDNTQAICEAFNATIVFRKFYNYSDQRNWAIEQVSDYFWQLHLDADEVIDDSAIRQINKILSGEVVPLHNAYLIKRRDYFMGKMLRFSGLNPWHLRFFRSGFVTCEDRLYDQHFITNSSVGKVKGYLHDKNMLSLSEWISRHNRWSDLEAAEFNRISKKSNKVLDSNLFGDPRERTRFFKILYYKIPAGIRSALYFLYRYILCFGFLDGKTGFYFSILQGYWFRILIDAKIHEAKRIENE